MTRIMMFATALVYIAKAALTQGRTAARAEWTDFKFWLPKVNNDHFQIINGESYALNGEDLLQGITVEGMTDCFGIRRSSMYLALDLKTKHYIHSVWPWQQGIVDAHYRRFLPDTHVWVCPCCIQPFHLGDGCLGYVCDSCRVLEDAYEEDYLFNCKQERKAEYAAYHRVTGSDDPAWEAILEEAYADNDLCDMIRADAEKDAAHFNKMIDEATECTCTEDQITEPGPYIDKCWYCQKVGMEAEAADAAEEEAIFAGLDDHIARHPGSCESGFFSQFPSEY